MELIVEAKYQHLITILKNSNFSNEDIQRIKDAFFLAQTAHTGQLRKSGEPYIIHPLSTAISLVDWKMDADTIIAGLLHDVVEDTNVTLEEIEKKFDSTISKLVSYVTKISTYSHKRRKNAVDSDRDNNYLKQIYLSLAEDNRAIIIKFADRLHNMQTINYVAPKKRILISKETLEIYGELAGRLGMYAVKAILQDLAFKQLEPVIFDEIKGVVDKLFLNGDAAKKNIISSVSKTLELSNISFEVKERNKSIYSIYRKINSGIKIEDIRDIIAVRFIVKTIGDCYIVLGKVHTNFKVIPNTFKDYIANPKPNLYQSIHTTIIYKNLTCEVQIRTKQMDELADYGIASHWRYKDTNYSYTQGIVNRIKTIIDEDPIQGLQKVKKEVLYRREITVFLKNTDQSRIILNGATILDLAFLIDPKRAFYLVNAKQDGSIVTISTKLNNNAEIEFNYGINETFEDKWLNFAITENAVVAIREKIDKNVKNISNVAINALLSNIKTEHGKKLLEKRIASLSFSNLEEFIKFVKEKKLTNSYIKKFYNSSDAEFKQLSDDLKVKIVDWLRQKEYVRPVSRSIIYNGIIISRCCTKIPGDHVIGIYSDDNKLFVHSINCKKIKELINPKIIDMEWNYEHLEEKPRQFFINLNINAQWDENINNEILKTIIGNGASISTFNIKKNKLLNKVDIYVGFYVKNTKNFEQINEKILLIPHIINSKRAD